MPCFYCLFVVFLERTCYYANMQCKEDNMVHKSDEERKAYYRVYNKIWYQRHKERLHEKRKQHDADLRVWLQQYKSQLQCIDCGETHPTCLQFHHRDREGKSFNIGGIIGPWRYITLKRL